MKTLIKLIIAAVLINAAFRGGTAFLKYYQFKDETQQMVLFGQSVPVRDLTAQILAEAVKRDVPVDDDDVMVSRSGTRTVAEVAYTENVELFPRFIYPVSFSFNAEAYGIPGAAGAAAPSQRPR
jgi:hypothetical protein